MNKDVIYIEPEDDITDIITKIEKAKNKIVALVPPKKAGVLRSIVNIKLIAKAGATAEKTIVLVTTDPSIVKLAAATKIPVAESLQSAPSVPTATAEVTTKVEKAEIEAPAENDAAETAAEGEETSETETEEAGADEAEDGESEEAGDDGDDDSGDNDDGDENDDADDGKKAKDAKKKEKKAKKDLKLTGNKVLDWIKTHKKMVILAGCGGLVLIVALIWAFGVAPAVDISVAIKTDQKNFSENITFVTDLKDENASEGKFYIEEKKVEDVKEVTFEATGKKNVGEKATGEVIIYAYFKEAGTVPVPVGSIFTISGLSYISNEAVTLSWEGKSTSECGNSSSGSIVTSGCLISGKAAVTAAQSGTKYNISASENGWNTVAPVAVYSDKAMTGGTDDFVTVVQQSDIEKAKENLTASSETVNKAKIMATVGENSLAIEDSFKQETSKATATPAADEEVKEGETPVLKTTTVATMYVVDKTKLEEFIEAKAKLEENQKIYKIENTYMESFLETDDDYTAKLKGIYFVGPKITEGELVEKILGKGLGDARREISDIYGVSDVTMNPSYPWVMSVPGDSNRVKITFEVQEQN